MSAGSSASRVAIIEGLADEFAAALLDVEEIHAGGVTAQQKAAADLPGLERGVGFGGVGEQDTLQRCVP